MPYSDEELLADIRAVADVVERSPSLQDYRDHGEYSVTTIYRRFDSWQGAVARAGFEPRDPNTRTSNADLIDALQGAGRRARRVANDTPDERAWAVLVEGVSRPLRLVG